MPKSPSGLQDATARPEKAVPETVPSAPDAGAARPGVTASNTRRKGRLRNPLLLLLIIGILVGATAYWRYSRHFESTDDAFIVGHVTTVSARVAGRVKEVLVTDNQQVRQGDILLRIDPADYQTHLDQARAALDTSRRNLDEAVSQQAAAQATADESGAQVASAQATADNAKKEQARYDRLLAERVVSLETKDNADTAARTSNAALDTARKKHLADQAQVALAGAGIETAKARVEQAQTAMEQAALDLAHTEVHARVSGRVTNKAVEPGDYLQTGQGVMSLVQPDVWVVANFKETQLTRMHPGQPATVVVDTFPDHELAAHVDSIQRGTGAAFSLLPPENATGNYVKVVQRVPVKIVLDRTEADADLALAPGMSVVPTVRVR